MEFINFPYLIEPSKSLNTYICVLFIVSAILLSIHYFLLFKKTQKNSHYSIKEAFHFIVFRPTTAFIVIALLAANAIKDNEVHQYDISPKYFTLQERALNFTVNPFPDGKRRVDDVYSITLFVNKISTNFYTQEKHCVVNLDMGHNKEDIIFSSEKNYCEHFSQQLYDKINQSKLKDYPKVKNITPIEYTFSLKEHNNSA